MASGHVIPFGAEYRFNVVSYLPFFVDNKHFTLSTFFFSLLFHAFLFFHRASFFSTFQIQQIFVAIFPSFIFFFFAFLCFSLTIRLLLRMSRLVAGRLQLQPQPSGAGGPPFFSLSLLFFFFRFARAYNLANSLPPLFFHVAFSRDSPLFFFRFPRLSRWLRRVLSLLLSFPLCRSVPTLLCQRRRTRTSKR